MLFPEIERRQNAVPLELIEKCLYGYYADSWYEWCIYTSGEPNCICVDRIKLLTAQGPVWELYTINWKDIDSYESYEINIDKRMILLNDSIRKTG